MLSLKAMAWRGVEWAGGVHMILPWSYICTDKDNKARLPSWPVLQARACCRHTHNRPMHFRPQAFRAGEQASRAGW